MIITTEYQQTNDIDWFGIVKGKPCHFASNGGKIPKHVINTLRELQSEVARLPEKTDYEEGDTEKINEIVKEQYKYLSEDGYIKTIPPRTMYIWSFIQMAQKGFYSYDRDAETDTYFLVAKPKDEDVLKDFKTKMPVVIIKKENGNGSIELEIPPYKIIEK